MPITPINRSVLSGTGMSPAHVREALDKIDEMIVEINAGGGATEADVLAGLSASAAAKDMGGGDITNTGLDFAGENGVVFVGTGGDLAEDRFNFFYNDTTKRLSLGAGASPLAPIDILAGNPGTIGGKQGGLLTLRSTAVGSAAISSISGHSSSATPLWYVGSFGASDDIMLIANRRNDGMVFSTNDTFALIIQANGNTQFVQGAVFGASDPVASARLDINSTTQGFLPPRMTTAQRDAISSPATGLLIYNTTTNKLNVRAAAAWEAVTSA